MRLYRKRDRRARIVVKALATVLVWVILAGYINIPIVQKYVGGYDQKAIITLALLFFVILSLWGLFNRIFHGYFLSAVLMIAAIIILSWLSEKIMQSFTTAFNSMSAENRNLAIVLFLCAIFIALDVRNFVITRNGGDIYDNSREARRRRRRSGW